MSSGHSSVNTAVLLSGGTGSRTNLDIPKQYFNCGGHMMVTYALKTLLECHFISHVCIVADNEWKDRIMSDTADTGLDVDRIVGFAKPGANRQGSILNGMNKLIECLYSNNGDEAIPNVATVLVHDAARPFLSCSLLEACYDSLGDYDGVMPVLPMKETVYKSRDGVMISELLNRDELFAGQAPELFRLGAYYRANKALSDEQLFAIRGASEPAIMYGMNIRMIPGDEENIKITTDRDVEIYRSKMLNEGKTV